MSNNLKILLLVLCLSFLHSFTVSAQENTGSELIIPVILEQKPVLSSGFYKRFPFDIDEKLEPEYWKSGQVYEGIFSQTVDASLNKYGLTDISALAIVDTSKRIMPYLSVLADGRTENECLKTLIKGYLIEFIYKKYKDEEYSNNIQIIDIVKVDKDEKHSDFEYQWKFIAKVGEKNITGKINIFTIKTKLEWGKASEHEQSIAGWNSNYDERTFCYPTVLCKNDNSKGKIDVSGCYVHSDITNYNKEIIRFNKEVTMPERNSQSNWKIISNREPSDFNEYYSPEFHTPVKFLDKGIVTGSSKIDCAENYILQYLKNNKIYSNIFKHADPEITLIKKNKYLDSFYDFTVSNYIKKYNGTASVIATKVKLLNQEIYYCAGFCVCDEQHACSNEIKFQEIETPVFEIASGKSNNEAVLNDINFYEKEILQEKGYFPGEKNYKGNKPASNFDKYFGKISDFGFVEAEDEKKCVEQYLKNYAIKNIVIKPDGKSKIEIIKMQKAEDLENQPMTWNYIFRYRNHHYLGDIYINTFDAKDGDKTFKLCYGVCLDYNKEKGSFAIANKATCKDHVLNDRQYIFEMDAIDYSTLFSGIEAVYFKELPTIFSEKDLLGLKKTSIKKRMSKKELASDLIRTRVDTSRTFLPDKLSFTFSAGLLSYLLKDEAQVINSNPALYFKDYGFSVAFGEAQDERRKRCANNFIENFFKKYLKRETRVNNASMKESNIDKRDFRYTSDWNLKANLDIINDYITDFIQYDVKIRLDFQERLIKHGEMYNDELATFCSYSCYYEPAEGVNPIEYIKSFLNAENICLDVKWDKKIIGSQLLYSQGSLLIKTNANQTGQESGNYLITENPFYSISGKQIFKEKYTPDIEVKNPSAKIYDFRKQVYQSELNKPSNNFDDLLFKAVKFGNINAVKQLLKNNFNPNVVDSLEMTPLHYAAKDCNFEIFNSLYQAGADATMFDTFLYTPLMYAAEAGCDDIVKLVVEDKGAEILCEKNNEGIIVSAVGLAIKEANIALYYSPKIDKKLKEKKLQLALYLLNKVFNIENPAKFKCFDFASIASDVNGNTPLMMIAGGFNTNFLKQFIKYVNPVINQKNKSKKDALMLLSKIGKIDAANVLIKNGADVCYSIEEYKKVNLADYNNYDVSNSYNKVNYVRNQSMKTKTTASSYAIENNHYDLARILIKEMIKRGCATEKAYELLKEKP